VAPNYESAARRSGVRFLVVDPFPRPPNEAGTAQPAEHRDQARSAAIALQAGGIGCRLAETVGWQSDGGEEDGPPAMRRIGLKNAPGATLNAGCSQE